MRATAKLRQAPFAVELNSPGQSPYSRATFLIPAEACNILSTHDEGMNVSVQQSTLIGTLVGCGSLNIRWNSLLKFFTEDFPKNNLSTCIDVNVGFRILLLLLLDAVFLKVALTTDCGDLVWRFIMKNEKNKYNITCSITAELLVSNLFYGHSNK